jgi:hypothetical protein
VPPFSIEDFINKSISEEDFRKDIEAYAKSKKLKNVCRGELSSKTDLMTSYLLRCSDEVNQIQAFENILNFCKRMYETNKSLNRAWSSLPKEMQISIQEKMCATVSIARSLRGERVHDALGEDYYRFIDEKDADAMMKISFKDHQKFAMLVAGLIYLIVVEKRNDKAVQKTLQIAIEERKKMETVFPPLEACRELQEEARKASGAKEVPFSVVPADLGHMISYEDEIKVKLNTEEWVPISMSEHVVNENGLIVFVRKK